MDLSGADFSGTVLDRANLGEANLSGADLSEANLRQKKQSLQFGRFLGVSLSNSSIRHAAANHNSTSPITSAAFAR